jgi:thiamine biosynthesis protein ThiI
MPAGEVLLVHYSEIALKGGKRSFFEKALARNLRRALGNDSLEDVKRLPGRIVVHFKGTPDRERISEDLLRVFGVSWFVFAKQTQGTYDDIERAVLLDLSDDIRAAGSFRVRAVRAFKEFPMDSIEINTRLGEAVVRNFGTKVQLKKPALTIGVEVMKEKAYVYGNRSRGLGGLPVGTSGRVICLLSGGIDSPVAAWLAMKRGARVSYIHFHPFPDNEEAIRSKISEIINHLVPYSGKTRCMFVPTYAFSLSSLRTQASYDVVLFRRFMLRCAERVAEETGASALVTGESLGQVASQTLENMAVIHRASDMPVLMPLIAYDKQEVIEQAKRIGTYELSLKPYKDCCSIIAKHPETKAKVEVVNELEAKIDVDKVAEECLSQAASMAFG